jgi:elongin-A
MPVKALMDLAMATIFKNIKELNNAGDFLPYETLRPILLKVDSARQLRQLEMNSPQIEGETGEVWLKLIEKDFPMEYRAHLFKPPDPTKWYKVYDKYKKIHDRSLQESEAKLRQALEGLKEDREKNTSKIVNQKVLPRFVKKRMGPRDNTVSAMTFNRGSRTKTLTGAGVMRKVRRETKEIANIHGSLSKAIRPPSRHAAASQIRQAPAAMVNDYQRAAKPAYRPTPKAPAEPPAIVRQHEARATYISDSGSDDEGGFEDEELFDDRRTTKGGFIQSKPSPASTASTRMTAPPPLPSKPSSSLLAARRGKGLLSSGRNPNVVIKTTSSKPKSSTGSASNPEPSERALKRAPSPDYDPPKRDSSMTSSNVSIRRPSDASRSATDSLPAPKPIIRKRKPVDVFMRSNKRTR